MTDESDDTLDRSRVDAPGRPPDGRSRQLSGMSLPCFDAWYTAESSS